MSSEYPKREKFYSHRFCRLLTKTAAAQEIGPEACWLLTVVVHQEDVKKYKGAVTYWNEQLMPLCGFGGRTRLVLARSKAVQAGWLHYEQGAKGVPAKYWTLIPERYEDIPDCPMDEDSDDFCRTEIGRQSKCRTESGHQVGRNPDGNQDGIPAPSLPVPIPKERAPQSGISLNDRKNKFIPPTVEQVTEYCQAKNLAIDPEEFVDHFTSNGWKVSGKSPMKDWPAALRNWAKRQKRFNGNGHTIPARKRLEPPKPKEEALA